MAHTSDPHKPARRHLRLLDPPPETRPLPVVVPLLRPNQPVTPAQDSLLTSLARRARRGDQAARDLLWRAFAARLEPVVRQCSRIAWQRHWARRDGRPWEMDDLRQEAWLVFADLTAAWNGEGSFVPYATVYFSWRLRNAMRRMGPDRRAGGWHLASGLAVDCQELLAAEGSQVLEQVMAALAPHDAALLALRINEGLSLGETARRLGVSRSTAARRWARIRRAAGALPREAAPPS